MGHSGGSRGQSPRKNDSWSRYRRPKQLTRLDIRGSRLRVGWLSSVCGPLRGSSHTPPTLVLDDHWMIGFARASKTFCQVEAVSENGVSVLFLTFGGWAGATVLEICGRWLAACCGQGCVVLAVLNLSWSGPENHADNVSDSNAHLCRIR